MIAIRGKITKESRGKLISYLLTKAQLRSVKSGCWNFQENDKEITVEEEGFELRSETLEVDEKILSFTDKIHLIADMGIVECSDSSAVRKHMETLSFLNQLAGVMENVELLAYYAGSRWFGLDVRGELKVDKLTEFKEIVKKIKDEAVTYAIAQSLARK